MSLEQVPECFLIALLDKGVQELAVGRITSSPPADQFADVREDIGQLALYHESLRRPLGLLLIRAGETGGRQTFFGESGSIRVMASGALSQALMCEMCTGRPARWLAGALILAGLLASAAVGLAIAVPQIRAGGKQRCSSKAYGHAVPEVTPAEERKSSTDTVHILTKEAIELWYATSGIGMPRRR
jgi:hypothetical protein